MSGSSPHALRQPQFAVEVGTCGESFQRSTSAPIAIDPLGVQRKDGGGCRAGGQSYDLSRDGSGGSSSSFERLSSAAETSRNDFVSRNGSVALPIHAGCSVENSTPSTPETEGASPKDAIKAGCSKGSMGKKWKVGRKYDVTAGLQFMALSDLGKLEEVLEWERSTGHSLDTHFFSLEKYTRLTIEDKGGLPPPSSTSTHIRCTCICTLEFLGSKWP